MSDRGCKTQKRLAAALVGATLVFDLVAPVAAQSAFAPVRSGTSGVARGPVAVTPFSVGPKVHMDPGHRACLQIKAEAQAQKTNPRIYEQILHVDNHCGQAIKIKACYPRSDRCVMVRIFGYQKGDVTLGIVFDGKIFDYQYTEFFP